MKKKFRGEHSSNTSSILRTITSATPSISVGQAVISDGYNIKLANSTNLVGTLTHAGIATSSGSAGNEISIIHHGLVDRNIFNLGDGYACAVGTDNNGNVVRVTDGYYASGLKYVGYCDGYGTITVAPRRADNFNVLDYGAKLDGVTDDLTPFNKAIAAAGLVSGTVLHPGGNAYLSDGLDAFSYGVTLEGVGVGANSGGTGSTMSFHHASHSGIYAWRQVNAESLASLKIRNLRIINANGSNSTGSAVEFMGGGDFTVEANYFAGWNYSVICDGAETVLITRNNFEGNDGYGVWCTNGSQRGNGWTITGSTNVINITKNTFNGPATCFFSQGGAVQYFTENECNSGSAWVADATSIDNFVFEKNYIEGVAAGTAGGVKMSACVAVAVKKNYVALAASSGGTVGVPFVNFHGTASNDVSIEDNVATAGATTSAVVTGCTSFVAGLHVGPNNFSNSGGAGSPLIFDADVSGTASYDTTCQNTDNTNNRSGVNTIKPTAALDVVGIEGNGGNALAVRGRYADFFRIVQTSTFNESHQHFRTLRSQGGSGDTLSGSTNGLAYLALAMGASSTPFGDTWAIPVYSWIMAEITLVAQGSPNTNGSVWKYELAIHRESSAPTTVDATLLYNKFTDTFTDPTFTYDGTSRALIVNVTGQSGYQTYWVVNVKFTTVAN